MREKALLGEDTIRDIYKRNYDDGGFDEVEFGKIVAEYQYGKFLALLCEEVEKVVIPYMRGSYYYSGAEGFKQQVLALLRGDKTDEAGNS